MKVFTLITLLGLTLASTAMADPVTCMEGLNLDLDSGQMQGQRSSSNIPVFTTSVQVIKRNDTRAGVMLVTAISSDFIFSGAVGGSPGWAGRPNSVLTDLKRSKLYRLECNIYPE